MKVLLTVAVLALAATPAEAHTHHHHRHARHTPSGASTTTGGTSPSCVTFVASTGGVAPCPS